MRAGLLVCVVTMAGAALGGCAKTSGYSLDLQNISGRPVRLDLVSKARGEEPKTVGTTTLMGGSHTTMFTKAERKADVTLEARVEGDQQSPPATMPVTLGLTRIDVIPASDRQQQDPEAPKLRLRSRD